MEQDQDPLASGEIHEGGAVVLQGSGRLSSTLVRRPPHPLAVPSLTPTIELPPPWQPWRSSFPSPTVAAEPSPVLLTLVVVVLVHRRSPPALTSMAGIDRLKVPPYVVNLCFGCFSRFKGTLQLFLMDVAKVDRRMLHILHMLQVFQKHVGSKCFIYFLTYVAIIFIWMLHMF